jgi:DNA-directed RNA polymerase specialized sigma24 family protein
MLLAVNSPWFDWGLLGFVVLCAAIFVGRAFTRPGAAAGPSEEESDHAESMAARRTAALEVRIYDFSREIEAKLEKRAVELDALVAAADREIVRLTDLLKKTSAGKGSRVPDLVRHADAASGVSGTQEQMILHLHGAGFSIAEISHMVGRPPEAVNSVLKAA